MTKPGIGANGVAETEADHFMKCAECDQWLDTLDLSQVIEHVQDGDIEVLDGPEQRHE
jgi:hypothetical protein